MALVTPQTTNVIVLGSGYLFFDLEDSAGALTGERYLGETPGFTVSVATPNPVEVYSDDGPTQELIRQFTSRVERSASITTKNVSADNLALFLIASASSRTGSGASVTAEAHTVSPGRWYQLGADDTNPAGVRMVTTVSITDEGAVTTYVEGTDYELDTDLARFTPLAGGAITADSVVEVSYTIGTETWDHLESSNLAAQYGALRYIADDQGDAQRDVYAPRVLLTPSGEWAVKSREAPQQLTFDTAFLRRTVAGQRRAQLYVNGRAV